MKSDERDPGYAVFWIDKDGDWHLTGLYHAEADAQRAASQYDTPVARIVRFALMRMEPLEIKPRADAIFAQIEQCRTDAEFMDRLRQMVEDDAVGLKRIVNSHMSCDRPPAGWYCSLPKGHVGPCPSRPYTLTEAPS